MWKVDQVLQIFAPFDCISCQKEGALLCRQCLVRTLPPPPGCCYKCRQPTVAALCRVCRLQTVLSSVEVVTSYTAVPRQLVGRLKFARTQAAAYTIAHIING